MRRNPGAGARPVVLVVALLATACSTPAGTAGGAARPASPEATDGPRIVATLDVRTPIDAQAAAGMLWLMGGPSGVLTEVDPATNEVVREIRPPHYPTAGAVLGHSVWIVSFADEALMELDARTGRIVRTIERSSRMPLVEPLGAVAVGGELWVVDHEPARLLRIDPRTGRLRSVTRLPGHAAYGPLVAAGRMWVVLSIEGAVVEVDPRTGTVGEPVAVDGGNCVSTSVADDDLWTTGADGTDGFPCRDVARRLDAATGEVAPQVYGEDRSLFAFASFGGAVWASDTSQTLYRVDVETGDLTEELTLPGGADVANHLLTAYGSLWVLRSNRDEVVRLEVP